MKSQQVFIGRSGFVAANGSFKEYIQLNRNYKKCCVKSISFYSETADTYNDVYYVQSDLFNGIFATVPNMDNAMNVIESEYQSNNLTGYQSSTYQFIFTDISGAAVNFSAGANESINFVIHLHFYDDEDCECK